MPTGRGKGRVRSRTIQPNDLLSLILTHLALTLNNLVLKPYVIQRKGRGREGEGKRTKRRREGKERVRGG